MLGTENGSRRAIAKLVNARHFVTTSRRAQEFTRALRWRGEHRPTLKKELPLALKTRAAISFCKSRFETHGRVEFITIANLFQVRTGFAHALFFVLESAGPILGSVAKNLTYHTYDKTA
jgi:hypothetical protein